MNGRARITALAIGLTGMVLSLGGCNRLAARDQLNKGVDAYKSARYEEAIGHFQAALKLKPNSAEAMNNLGVLLVRQRDYAQAEDQFKTCIRLVPSFDQSYINLARLYVVQNDKVKGIEILQQLLREQPENAEAKKALGMLE